MGSSTRPRARPSPRIRQSRLHQNAALVQFSGIDNGPLRIIARSHRSGRLSAEQIGNWNKETSVTCTVPKGGALVMRLLLLHASSSCATPKSRRVIHLEFATAELPHGLDWHDRFQLNSRIPSLSLIKRANRRKLGLARGQETTTNLLQCDALLVGLVVGQP